MVHTNETSPIVKLLLQYLTTLTCRFLKNIARHKKLDLFRCEKVAEWAMISLVVIRLQTFEKPETVSARLAHAKGLQMSKYV